MVESIIFISCFTASALMMIQPFLSVPRFDSKTYFLAPMTAAIVVSTEPIKSQDPLPSSSTISNLSSCFFSKKYWTVRACSKSGFKLLLITSVQQILTHCQFFFSYKMHFGSDLEKVSMFFNLRPEIYRLTCIFSSASETTPADCIDISFYLLLTFSVYFRNSLKIE